MRRLVLAVAGLIALAFSAGAQTLVNGQQMTTVTALPVQPPFQRSGGAFAFPVSTTPQTFAVTAPDGVKSYRGVNTCFVDIAITSVAPTAQPVSTQPATFNGQTIPNVLAVTSATGSADQFTSTIFLARTTEALGSTPNPAAGPVRYVSIMALSAPASPCTFRLGYGNGG